MTNDQGSTTLTERIVSFKKRSKTVRRLIELLPRWLTPNLVTAFRMALAIPLCWTLMTGRYWTALAVFTVAMALDALDGAIAHVRNMNTALGAFLDPLADKVLVYGALLALWAALPFWITLLVGGSLLFATALTLLRIFRLVRARRLSGPELARTVAAKPAGKVKTMFDVAGAVLIIVGMATVSSATVNAGGALIVIGSFVAGFIFFYRQAK